MNTTDPYLQGLLQKQLSGTLEPDEYAALADRLSVLSNDTVSRSLQPLWENYEHGPCLHITEKTTMLHRIRRKAGRTPHTLFAQGLRVAAILIPALFAMAYFLNEGRPAATFTVLAEAGQKTHIHLPDSTEVWLNSNSRLTYTSDFNAKDRHVVLDGEGWFEVRKSAKKKFTVETEKVNVIVHGTTFNVSAYADDPVIEVALDQGKVALENKTDHTLITRMTPNHLVTVDKVSMRWNDQPCQASLTGIWHEHMLRFTDASAEEVFRKMEQWYGIHVSLENSADTLHYGFTLKNESLREMLDLINRITPITYRINGEEVMVRYQ